MEGSGGQPEGRQAARTPLGEPCKHRAEAGPQLTLFHVKHIHCPQELGLPVQPALPQASQAVQVVVQGHKAGESPFAGDVGKLGPGASFDVKDLKGIDRVLGLASPWRPEQGGGEWKRSL